MESEPQRRAPTVGELEATVAMLRQQGRLDTQQALAERQYLRQRVDKLEDQLTVAFADREQAEADSTTRAVRTFFFGLGIGLAILAFAQLVQQMKAGQ
jgi:hypothetical protein